MKIEILGPGCMRCITAEQNVRQALDSLRLSADIVHIFDPKEIAKRGIEFTPAVVIEGVTRSSGRIPEVAEIRRWLEERAVGLEKQPHAQR